MTYGSIVAFFPCRTHVFFYFEFLYTLHQLFPLLYAVLGEEGLYKGNHVRNRSVVIRNPIEALTSELFLPILLLVWGGHR